MKKIPVSFKNEGEKIFGILHLPDIETYKIVILVPGLTGTKDGPGGVFIELAKKLTENGFAVLRFNFRYVNENFKQHEKMTISGEVSDLKLIIKKMRKKFKEIGLVGESMGGAVSILSYDKKISCLALWYPVIFFKETSLEKWLSSKEAIEELKLKGYVTGYKVSLNKYYKLGKDFIEERKKINLITKIKGITCPTLLVHGDKDTTVKLNQPERAIRFLKIENKKLEVIKGMEHAFYDITRKYKVQEHKDRAIELTVDWFKKWLK